MKKLIQSLLVVAALAGAAFTVQAQPTPKILVLDLEKVFNDHYKTKEQNTKLQGDQVKAQEQLDVITKEGNVLVEQFKELDEQAKNPAANAEAKAKSQAAAQKKYEEIRQKQNERDTFVQNTRTTLQQRFQTFKTLMIEEITKVAVDVAKRRGATLLIDKSGPSMIGVSNVLYFDPSMDITAEVIADINKDRPATSLATPAPATAPASGSAAPSIVVPKS
jgi:outer membrane protein